MVREYIQKSTGTKVRAIQFEGNFEDVENFVHADVEFRTNQLIVPTFNGPLYVLPHDWIIQFPEGFSPEFQSCGPISFAGRYEPAANFGRDLGWRI